VALIVSFGCIMMRQYPGGTSVRVHAIK